jgi:hypothetical protein
MQPLVTGFMMPVFNPAVAASRAMTAATIVFPTQVSVPVTKIPPVMPFPRSNW